MKKNLLIVAMVLCSAITIFAQNNKISYQAVVRNNANELVADATVQVAVSILDANNDVQYAENHPNAKTNINGLLSLLIGDGTQTSTTTLADVVWANASVRTVITLPDGTQITSVTPVTAIPYALYADNVNPAALPQIPVNVSDFNNDAGYLTDFTEIDPTVPAWAKAVNKPTYDYSEIANTPTIPTVPENVSAFNNDAGYLTDYTETDPTVPAWAKAVNKPTYDYSEIANTPTIPTVPENVSDFNNDAGYITSADIPQIPTVPSDVSAFNNDAGYVSNASCDTVDVCTLAATIAQLQKQIQDMQKQLMQLPVVSTDTVYQISYHEATVLFTLIDDGGANITSFGVCFSTQPNPTIESNEGLLQNNGNGDNGWCVLPELEDHTTYYVKAFATNRVGTAYGEEKVFTTLAVTTPTVSYLTTTAIRYTTARLRGRVTDNGGSDVTDKGFCWSVSHNPTIEDAHASFETETGMNYNLNIDNLTDGTTYYVRAYATNAMGIAYSEEAEFTTLTIVPPTVTTEDHTYMSPYLYGGRVTSDGGADVTERGLCWSTHQNPTIEDAHAIDESGSTNITYRFPLTNLVTSTTYYVRAYAINSMGTSYGNSITFTSGDDGLLCQNLTSVTDYDGNVYSTVKIGSQCWMAENLRTTHYSNGVEVPKGNTKSTTIAYHYYPNNDTNNVSTYGLLYNFSAVVNGAAFSEDNPSEVQGICPEGWHVPSYNEWRQLDLYLCDNSQFLCASSATSYPQWSIAKSLASTSGWSENGNICAIGNTPSNNNTAGFGAMPTGYYDWHLLDEYSDFSQSTSFWTTSDYLNYGMPFIIKLSTGSHQVEYTYCNLDNGHPVRCLKD